ncbi:hypothetical protein [Anaerosporobacter sp.]|uniref:hypothetical protein n=1 Tax=Anaerosporobacter sp. TaxID=1872529 RepID=UPI00286EDB73|nr:hypothetical protein [Anaerosporobacter sp.]
MSKKPLILSCVVLLFILSFTGCKKQNKQYGYAPMFDKLTWGMSFQEVVNTMQLTKQNAKVVNAKENSVYTIIQLNDTYEKYGMKATVNLLITEGKEDTQEEYSYPTDALSAVVLQYGIVDADTLRANMEKELGEAKSDKTDDFGVVIVWKSKDRIASVYKAEQKAFYSYCEELKARGNESLSPKEKNTVNKITLSIANDGKCVVTYYGDWAIYINRSR